MNADVAPAPPLAREQFLAHFRERAALGQAGSGSALLGHYVDFVLASAQPMYLILQPGLRLLFNEAMCPLMGPDSLEALGRPMQDVFADIWGDIEPHVEQAFLGQSGLFEDVPLRSWRSGFEELGYWTFSYTPIDDNGSVVGAVWTLSETTEKVVAKRKLQEERDALRDMFENAPGFLAFSEGPEHRITFVNGTYRRFFGRNDAVGRTIAEAFPEFEGQRVIAILDKVYATGEPFAERGLELNLVLDGEPVTRRINVVFSPVRGADGAVTGLFAEGHDVTEEYDSRKRIDSLQAELIHVSRLSAMGTLASTIAHELNQPLMSVANYVRGARRILERQAAGELGPVIDALAAADDHAVRAGEIIRRVRELVTRGILKKAPRRVAGIVEAARTMALPNPSLLGIDYVEHIDPSAGKVLVDDIQIQQVLINLLRNAVDAAQGERPRITVTAAPISDRVCAISVDDNGAGVPSEIEDRLFEPFASTKLDGLGVGLSISRTIVEAHGGKLWFEKGSQGGAAFRFTLERAR